MEFARGKAIVTAVVGVEEGESGRRSEREWLWLGTVNGGFSFSCEVVVEAEERSGSGGDAHGMYNDGSFCKEMGMQERGCRNIKNNQLCMFCWIVATWRCGQKCFFKFKNYYY